MDTLLRIGLGNAAQAAALAVAAALAGRLCRHPAVRHGLWLLVLLKLLIPSAVPVLPLWPSAPAVPPTPTAGSTLLTVPTEPVATSDEEDEPPAPADDVAASVAPADPPSWPSWQPVVGGVWLAGSLGWWGLALVRVGRFRRALRLARPAPPDVQARADRLARRFGLARCPAVLLLDAPAAPMLWALGRRPRLLVPAGLWDQLDGDGRDALLAHELAHLRRGDPWVRRLELVVLGLYWWHPAAWWARRQIEEAEEECCDAWVVRALPAAADAYAAALVSAVGFLAGGGARLPAGASGMRSGQLPLLKRRLTMILNGTTTGAARGAGLTALVLGAAVSLGLPTWVQGEPPADKPPAEVIDFIVEVAGDDDDDAVAKDRAKLEMHLKELSAALNAKRAELAALETKLQMTKKMLETTQAQGDKLKLQGLLEKKTKTTADKAPTDATLRLNVRDLKGQPDKKPLPEKKPLFEKKPLGLSTDGGSAEQRLQDLEKKMELLMKEMSALRRDLKPKPDKAQPK